MTQIYQRLSEGAIEAWDGLPFDGAKGAVLWRGGVVTLLRDARADLPYAGMWDLPGGAREGAEIPFETFAREACEEIGMDLNHGVLLWQRGYRLEKTVWFLVVQMPDEHRAPVLGNEGQAVKVVGLEEYIEDETAIPALRERLKAYLQR